MSSAETEMIVPCTVLRPASIRPFLDKEIELRWKECTGTTNDDAKSAAREGLGEAVFLAEQQVNAKGRAGRHWISGRGEAVELSLLLRPRMAAADAAGLSLAAGLAAADTIQDTTALVPQVKWPNDVLVGGKKICGILCEAAVDSDSLVYAVVGIGVNVNQKSFDGQIAHTATSLAIEGGKALDRAFFAATLISRVCTRVEQLAEGGLPAIMPDYERTSSLLDAEVDVFTKEGTVTGTCVGFGHHGELMVETSGGLQVFLANDVSVRGSRDV